MSLEIQENVILAPYTLYKIGGPARFFIEVKSSEELKEALLFSLEKKLPFVIIGAGTNILISDRGFSGLAVKIKDGRVKTDGDKLTADAGVMMAKAVLESSKAGLTGLEWGIGIPGTVGGSIRGNAGCFGGETGRIIELVQLLEFPISNFQFPNKSQIPNFNPQILTFSNKDCKFEYRDSIFKKHPEWIILSATFKLQKGDPEEIKEKIKNITLERSAKQDIGTKTCGCIFKNISWSKIDKENILEKFPEMEKFRDKPSLPASFLVDSAGLKNKKIGQVSISPKHANFFVNEGAATAEDVRKLIKITKDEVKNKFGVELEEEIQYIGF